MSIAFDFMNIELVIGNIITPAQSLILLNTESPLQLCVPMKHSSISVYVDHSLHRGRMSIAFDFMNIDLVIGNITPYGSIFNRRNFFTQLAQVRPVPEYPVVHSQLYVPFTFYTQYQHCR